MMYAEGTQFFDLDDLKEEVTIKNVRKDYLPSRIQDLASDIADKGLLQDIIVKNSMDATGSRVVEVVGGFYRRRAIELIKETDIDLFAALFSEGIPCKMLSDSTTTQEAEFINIAENLQREDINDSDLAEVLYEQLKKTGMTQAALAKKVGKSAEWMSKRILFHKRAGPALKEAVRDGSIAFIVGYELAKNYADDFDAQVAFLQKQASLNLKVTLTEAKKTNTKDDDGVSLPSKSEITRMLSRAITCSEDVVSEYASGVKEAIQWITGELGYEDINESMRAEEG